MFLAQVLEKNEVALFNASVRFVKQDPLTKLSYNPDCDRFAVVLFFNQKLNAKAINRTKRWVREVTEYLIAHRDTYYLPYQPFATPSQFRACYKNADKVIQAKAAFDPNGIFETGFSKKYLTLPSESSSMFREIFSYQHEGRRQVRMFLDNIFMQMNPEQFFMVMDEILEDEALDDEEIYKRLCKKIGVAKPNAIIGAKRGLKALSLLKNDLGQQTLELVDSKNIKGYVEIGYPGRMIRTLKKLLKMQGPFYVINDKEQIADYLESGFPRPYQSFLPLNEYDPINPEAIPDASVDLVCLYIGLHHIPKEKLQPFLASIARILRPGGHFILIRANCTSI